MAVTGLSMIKLSVSALERSLAFYGLLGFVPKGAIAKRDDPSVGQLYGLRCDRLRMQVIQLEGVMPALRIELIEWGDHGAGGGNFAEPGAAAIGLTVSDLEDDIRKLAAAGHAPVTAVREFPGNGRVTRLVNVADPDGTMVQLVEVIRTAA